MNAIQHALPVSELLSASEELIIGDANRLAAEMLLHTPPDTATSLLWLHGEAGCGKSLLASQWAARTDATMLEVPVGETALPTNVTFAVIDPLPDALSEAQERWLFHLMNHIRQAAGQLLICTDRAPGAYNCRLPDLRSRIRAAGALPIAAPDEAMLSALLQRHFAQRQIRVPSSVIAYLVRRMPRTYRDAQHIVDLLDRASIEAQRSVSISLAKQVIDRITASLAE